MSSYPSPDSLQLPPLDDPSPDQQYYVGWLVQHNRLWLTTLALGALCVLLVVLLFTQTAKYRPTVQYVTLDGGYTVVWNEAGNPVIDGVEYSAPRLRAVVQTFVENRYAYDWQFLSKINTALNVMSPEAEVAERQKIAELNPQATIIGARLKVDLKIDYTNYKVVAQGKGRFAVKLQGEARFTDAVRNTDPNHPAVKPVTIDLVVETIKPTDLNPLGYRIISTGRDIL